MVCIRLFLPLHIHIHMHMHIHIHIHIHIHVYIYIYICVHTRMHVGPWLYDIPKLLPGLHQEKQTFESSAAESLGLNGALGGILNRPGLPKGLNSGIYLKSYGGA